MGKMRFFGVLTPAGFREWVLAVGKKLSNKAIYRRHPVLLTGPV
jgi:hypothetical protein